MPGRLITYALMYGGLAALIFGVLVLLGQAAALLFGGALSVLVACIRALVHTEIQKKKAADRAKADRPGPDTMNCCVKVR